jgi:hypothetical protein
MTKTRVTYDLTRGLIGADVRRLQEVLARELQETLEPPRVCRRPFGLSYAAMAGSSSMA